MVLKGSNAAPSTIDARSCPPDDFSANSRSGTQACWSRYDISVGHLLQAVLILTRKVWIRTWLCKGFLLGEKQWFYPAPLYGLLFSLVWLLGLLVLVIVCWIGSHWHARIHDTGYRYRFVRSLSLRGNRIVFCVLSPVKDLCLKAVQKRAFLSGKKV
jgi:hypothetical protein